MNMNNIKKYGPLVGILAIIFFASFLIVRHEENRRINKNIEQEQPIEVKTEIVEPIPTFGDEIPPMGYEPNKDGTKKFLESLDKPYLKDAGPNLFRAIGPEPDDVFLYRSLYKHYKAKYGRDFVVEKQMIGDCVSWGYAHGVATHLAVLCDLNESSEFWFPSTEAIYGGSRVEARGLNGNGTSPVGGYSDGSYGAAASKFLTKWGVIYRDKYDFADLTTYSGSRAKEWGAYGCGGKGDNGKADTLAKKFPIKSIALVRTYEEAEAAIRSGYPIPICSGQGFSSVRDKDGFAKDQGSWMHCMVLLSVRKTGREGMLCLNSWGPKWISGPKFPSDQPDGSFWVEKHVVQRILSQQDSFAISGLEGFPFNDLNNGDWVNIQKPQTLTQEEPFYVLTP